VVPLIVTPEPISFAVMMLSVAMALMLSVFVDALAVKEIESM
jgi:hypothetical protein